MKITNYKEAINYLETFISPILFRKIEQNPKYDPLERTRVLLKLLGDPQKKFKSILITGTAGKGSTAYLISHILTAAGYKTGFTLSPHLEKVNERLQINGKEISDKEFTRMVASMIRIIEAMIKTKVGAPSYFEILIAMAFKYFACPPSLRSGAGRRENQKVDIAVVEVGIEGKYDATNILNPLIVVLTNIYLDHTQILGETVEEIANEAVGAIKSLKEKQVVITGATQVSVIKIIEEKAKEMNAKLYRLGKDFRETNLKISLLGEYQKQNASLAIKAVLELKRFGFKITDKVIKEALSTAFFPGRFEILKCHPELVSGSKHGSRKKMLKQVQHDKGTTLVLDGAHNPAKMKAFISSLNKLFPTKKKTFLIAFKKDKNIKEMLPEILKSADNIVVTEFGRATDVALHASAESLMIKDELLRMKYRGKITVEKDSKKALEKAIKMKPELLVVTGSLYLVGEIRNQVGLRNQQCFGKMVKY